MNAITNSGVLPSKIQAEQLKQSSESGELTEGSIYATLVRKGNGKVNVTISAKKINYYFPPTYTKEQIEEVIYTLLDKWKQEEREGGLADAENTV